MGFGDGLAPSTGETFLSLDPPHSLRAASLVPGAKSCRGLDQTGRQVPCLMQAAVFPEGKPEGVDITSAEQCTLPEFVHTLGGFGAHLHRRLFLTLAPRDSLGLKKTQMEPCATHDPRQPVRKLGEGGG